MAQPSAAPHPSQCSIPVADPDMMWQTNLLDLHTGFTGDAVYENLGSQHTLALSDMDCVALITADDPRPRGFRLFQQLLALNGLPFPHADFEAAWGRIMAFLTGIAGVVFAGCHAAGLADGAMPLALAQYVGTFLLRVPLEKCVRLVMWSCKGYVCYLHLRDLNVFVFACISWLGLLGVFPTLQPLTLCLYFV